MSDLRTRIASALYCHAAQSVATGVPWLNWEDAFPVVLEVWLSMADAVIAELNLTTPVEYLSVDGSRQNYMVAGHYTEDVNDETD